MTTQPQRVFITDCEGPISKNDNAFELASHFIPDGQELFTLISRYDDVQADIVRRPGYKAGDTLRLILPFLKAYDVTNNAMKQYSSQHILLVPQAKETLEFIRKFMPAYIISTSYQQYMHALCTVIGFPFENVHATQLDLDRYEISQDEKTRIRQLKEEMTKLPVFDIPKDSRSLDGFPKKLQQTVRRLDEIFWKEISSMEIGRTLKEVNPVGGAEKAAAITDIAKRLNTDLQNVMYVGDSITDVEAFRLVRNNGGLTLSFNGNNYAIREAEAAALSESAVVTAVLANFFHRFGKAQTITLIRDWQLSSVEKYSMYQPLKQSFFSLHRKKPPTVELVTAQNIDRLMLESTEFRKKIRGQSIGQLG